MIVFLCLHLLTSLIKLIVWQKFFHRQKAGRGYGVGGLVRAIGSCSVSTLCCYFPDEHTWKEWEVWVRKPSAGPWPSIGGRLLGYWGRLESLVGKEPWAALGWRTTEKFRTRSLGQGGKTTFRLMGISWRVFTLVNYPSLQHYPLGSIDDFKIHNKILLITWPLSFSTSSPTVRTSGFKFVCLWPNHV